MTLRRESEQISAIDHAQSKAYDVSHPWRRVWLASRVDLTLLLTWIMICLEHRLNEARRLQQRWFDHQRLLHHIRVKRVKTVNLQRVSVEYFTKIHVCQCMKNVWSWQGYVCEKRLKTYDSTIMKSAVRQIFSYTSTDNQRRIRTDEVSESFGIW